jgi:hypothetical protein
MDEPSTPSGGPSPASPLEDGSRLGVVGALCLFACLTLLVGGGALGFHVGRLLSHRFEVIIGLAGLGVGVGVGLLVLVYQQLPAPREGRGEVELVRCLLITPAVAAPPCLLAGWVVSALEPSGGLLELLIVPPAVAAAGGVAVAMFLGLLAFRLRRGPVRPTWIALVRGLEELALGAFLLFLVAMQRGDDSAFLRLFIGGWGVVSVGRGAMLLWVAWGLRREPGAPAGA